jgi:type II secretory pathway predicted ATPase ExeA
MYLEHFGLHEAPFRITPHTDFFFGGSNRGATLDALTYAVTHNEGIVKISGEVGSGKTMLCRMLIERLPKNITIIYLGNPSLSREDILYAIADELKLTVPENSRNAAILRLLQEHLVKSFSTGGRVIVLIDEAHAMPTETLEEIRLLSNLEFEHRKLLQLVLFGQPELNGILRRPEMRQLKERITHNFWLEPLIRDDIANYLDFRMRAAGYKGPSIFSPAAIRMIAQSSLGLTRRINVLADKALAAAFSSGGHLIGVTEVSAAIRDCEFSDTAYTDGRSMLNSPKRLLALAALLGVCLWGLLNLNSQSTVPSSAEIPQATTIHATPPEAQSPPAPSPTTAAPSPNTVNPYQDLNLGPMTLERLMVGSNWLKTAPDETWFLQLSIRDLGQKDQLERLLNKVSETGIDMQLVRVYYSTLSGRPRLGIIYGEYSSQAVAITASKSLPPQLRVMGPYPRQVVRLK